MRALALRLPFRLLGYLALAIACLAVGASFARTASAPFEGPGQGLAQATSRQGQLAATATPTPLPDRESCEEIRGSEYRSEAERGWYLANCVPTPTPVPAVPPPNPPPIPGPEVPGERWILVDIARQRASAMIGDRVLYTALVTTGKEGWETPTGTFRILYRVANETMTSDAIGAEEYYVLTYVLYTQYFTYEGHALHLNYWRPEYYFGNIPSSHGCIGMRLADAEFFWHFARAGTRVTIQ